MCGIFGAIGEEACSAEQFEHGLAMLRHRGPDGEGRLVLPGLRLGMRRLSIIDRDNGSQPFHSAGNQVTAFQNGEIYNHKELRRDLEGMGFQFRSRCDTEVLAHGYVAWGMEGLLNRLDGMFAVSILDQRSNRLYLARDAFGEKPLFIAAAPARFAYASSLRVLAALPWVDDTVDPDALDRYLALHFVPGGASILKGIRRLEAGEWMEVDATSGRIMARHHWYRPALGEVRSREPGELEAVLEAAVASRLMADVPVGVFLSGGVDSALVAAMAARHHPELTTFSMGFSTESHDESAFAAEVARHIGSRHFVLQFDSAAFGELLPKSVQALDEPLGDQALLPLFWLSGIASQEVSVVLSGEGADEVFGGYFYYQGIAEGTQTPQATIYDAGRNSFASGYPLVAEAHARRRLTGRSALSETQPWESRLREWLDGAASPLQRVRAADLAAWLPDNLLPKLDRMTMGHSLEGRAPYLSRQVVELGLSLPDRQVWANGQNKSLLRDVAKSWLPPGIAARPKQGFCLPMRQWLKQYMDECGGPRQCFKDVDRLGLDPEGTTRLVEEDLAAGVIRDRLLMALLMLVEWRRTLVPGASVPSGIRQFADTN